jgi:hypothetical protein
VSPPVFIGDVGAVINDGCVVAVHDAAGGWSSPPPAGIGVRFEVLEGPLEFEERGRSAVVVTDDRGFARVDLRFTGRGSVLVGAELEGGTGERVVFVGHSEGVTHELVLDAPPAVAADPGVMEVRVSGFDHHGDPVGGAELILEATLEPDLAVRGEIRDREGGRYDGTLEVHVAGEWTLIVRDPASQVLAYRCFFVVPADPERVAIVGEVDPRREAPRDRLGLQVALVDRYGNPLDPDRLGAVVDGEATQTTHVGDEARLELVRRRSGAVAVEVGDAQSGVERSERIEFRPYAVGPPTDPIVVGREFSVSLFLFPPEDPNAGPAVMELAYDAERIVLERFEDPRDGRPLRQRPLPGPPPQRIEILADDFPDEPDGEEKLVLVWKPMGTGDLFSDWVLHFPESFLPRPMPASELWAAKVEQTVDICVNLIYREGDHAAKHAGERNALKIPDVISSLGNRLSCCPTIRVKGQHQTVLKDSDWKKMPSDLQWSGAIRAPSVFDELTKSSALDYLRRPHCWNLWLLPIHPGVAAGFTQPSSIGPPRQSLIDPDSGLKRDTIGAHEFGHACGLPDLYKYREKPDQGMVVTDPGPYGSLMSSGSGTWLTEDECATLARQIGQYAER